MIDEYRLVLTHYAVDERTGDKYSIDEPLCIRQVYDRRYCDGGSPILLNRMFDELKAYALSKMERSESADKCTKCKYYDSETYSCNDAWLPEGVCPFAERSEE